MTEKKKVVKKEVAKKVTPKVEPKQDATKQVEVVKESIKETKTPERKKRVEIERNALIPCRSNTHGSLIYIANRSGAKYVWEDIGTVLDLEMQELQEMNGSKRKFLHDGYLTVEDEDVAEQLGLSKLYKQIAHIDNIEELFEKDTDELFEIVPQLPKAMKATLATKAREMIQEGTLDRMGKINALEDLLNVDLKAFVK